MAATGGTEVPVFFTLTENVTEALKNLAASGSAHMKNLAKTFKDKALSLQSLRDDVNALDRAFRDGMGRIADISKVAMAAVGAALTGAAVVGAKFEAAIAEAVAVSGGSLETLSAAAREAGAATVFSATEAAEALTELAKAGLTADQAAVALNDTLVLAQASQMNLAEASALTVQTLAQFQLSATESQRAADGLVAAANASTADVKDLGESLKYAGGVAHGFGLSLEETLTFLAQMSNLGFQGSMSGTALANALAKMTDVTNKGAGILQKYGLTVADVSTKHHKLQDVVETFAKTTIDAGDIIELFGDRAGRPFVSLIKSAQDSYKATGDAQQGFKDMFQMIAVNGAGSAQKFADVMGNTVSGAFKELTGIVEELALSVNDLFKGDLREGIDGLTGLLRDNKQAIIEFVVEIMKRMADLAIFLLETADEWKEVIGVIVISVGHFVNNVITGIKTMVTVVKLAFSGLLTLLAAGLTGWADRLQLIDDILGLGLSSKLREFAKGVTDLSESVAGSAVKSFDDLIDRVTTNDERMQAFDQTVASTGETFGEFSSSAIKRIGQFRDGLDASAASVKANSDRMSEIAAKTKAAAAGTAVMSKGAGEAADAMQAGADAMVDQEEAAKRMQAFMKVLHDGQKTADLEHVYALADGFAIVKDTAKTMADATEREKANQRLLNKIFEERLTKLKEATQGGFFEGLVNGLSKVSQGAVDLKLLQPNDPVMGKILGTLTEVLPMIGGMVDLLMNINDVLRTILVDMPKQLIAAVDELPQLIAEEFPNFVEILITQLMPKLTVLFTVGLPIAIVKAVSGVLKELPGMLADTVTKGWKESWSDFKSSLGAIGGAVGGLFGKKKKRKSPEQLEAEALERLEEARIKVAEVSALIGLDTARSLDKFRETLLEANEAMKKGKDLSDEERAAYEQWMSVLEAWNGRMTEGIALTSALAGMQRQLTFDLDQTSKAVRDRAKIEQEYGLLMMDVDNAMANPTDIAAVTQAHASLNQAIEIQQALLEQDRQALLEQRDAARDFVTAVVELKKNKINEDMEAATARINSYYDDLIAKETALLESRIEAVNAWQDATMAAMDNLIAAADRLDATLTGHTQRQEALSVATGDAPGSLSIADLPGILDWAVGSGSAMSSGWLDEATKVLTDAFTAEGATMTREEFDAMASAINLLGERLIMQDQAALQQAKDDAKAQLDLFDRGLTLANPELITTDMIRAMIDGNQFEDARAAVALLGAQEIAKLQRENDDRIEELQANRDKVLQLFAGLQAGALANIDLQLRDQLKLLDAFYESAWQDRLVDYAMELNRLQTANNFLLAAIAENTKNLQMLGEASNNPVGGRVVHAGGFARVHRGEVIMNAEQQARMADRMALRSESGVVDMARTNQLLQVIADRVGSPAGEGAGAAGYTRPQEIVDAAVAGALHRLVQTGQVQGDIAVTNYRR